MSTFTNHENGMPCWVDVNVDTEEQHHDLRAFLSALFDWTWDLGGPEMGYYSLALHNGAPVLGLSRMEGAKGETTTYFSTSAIEDAIQRGVELGASVAMPKTEIMELGQMAIMVDPNGATYGLWQSGTFHGFGAQYEENAPGWFDNVSADPERAGTFYAGISGHQCTPLEGDMRILQNGEQWYASLTPLSPGESAQWKPVFVVDSLERIHEVVPRHGGAVLIKEMPVPGSALCVFSEPVNGTVMTVMRGGERPS